MWDIMRERYWRDTPADGDRMRRRMAEFLVYQHVPGDLVGEIGVMTDQTRDRLQVALDGIEDPPHVSVRRDWYYT